MPSQLTLATILDHLTVRLNSAPSTHSPHLDAINAILLDPLSSLIPSSCSPLTYSTLPELTYLGSLGSVPFPGVSSFILSPRYLSPASSALINSDDSLFYSLELLSAQLRVVEALHRLHKLQLAPTNPNRPTPENSLAGTSWSQHVSL